MGVHSPPRAVYNPPMRAAHNPFLASTTLTCMLVWVNDKASWHVVRMVTPLYYVDPKGVRSLEPEVIYLKYVQPLDYQVTHHA